MSSLQQTAVLGQRHKDNLNEIAKYLLFFRHLGKTAPTQQHFV